MPEGSLYIGGQQYDSLPAVIDEGVVQQLLSRLATGNDQQRIVAAHTLSHLLETEEAKYRCLVGDPHINPNLRTHYTIGKVLAVIKDDEDTYDAVVDSWVTARGASLEQQVAGLRLLHACLDCWLFQYPLTEESLVEKLGLWAMAGLSKQQQQQQQQQQQDQQQQDQQQQQQPAVLGDPDPAALTAFMEEAKATYALGLLGIALANEEYADEAVQTQLIPTACRYLQKAVMTQHQLSAAQHAALVQQQQQQHAASWDRHKTPAKPALKAAAAAAATAAAVADGSPSSQDQVMQDGSADAARHQLQQQQQASGALSPYQQQQQQVPDAPGNAFLLLVAASPDGCVSECVPSHEVLQLRLRKLLGVMRVLTCTGEYVEALGPFLSHQGVEACCVLLQTWRSNGVLLNEALQVVCSLLAHRRFGELLVEHGGVQLLLALPRNSHTNMGLSLTLFGLASLPLAFERTCALPAPVPAQLVQAGLGLLAAANDAARKNAALFFDSAVHYPVLLDCFDECDGLHRLLYPLRHVVQLLQAGGPAELRAERQVAYHASRALLQYIRAQLVIHLTALQRRLRDGPVPSAPPQPHKPINTTAAAVDELITAVSTDAKLAEAFVRTRWPLLERLDQHRLVPLLLDLVRVLPGEERYFSDITLYGLEVLQLVTLSPLPRRAIIAAGGSSSSSGSRGGQAGSSRSGMATLLHAASTGNAQPFYGLADPEVIATALQVVVNCVTAPPSLAYLLPPPGSAAGGGGGTGTSGAPGGVALDKTSEPHQTPQPVDTPSSAELAAPPALELGPSAVSAGRPPSLGDALEAGYAAARQAVRSSNGIRVLLMLLQSRQHLAPAAADRVRALACMAVLGLARDGSIRHILTKLQVGKLLAELVREPVAPGAAGGSSSRREVNAGSESSTGGHMGALWQERFHKAALELIAITTSSGAGGGGRAETRLAAAAATDAAAPALLKIERAAIAAATPISYQPQELLLLIYEHLKASGLHSAAASLAREAGLASSGKPAAAAAAAMAVAAAAAGWQQQGQAGSASPMTGVSSLPMTPSAAAAAAAAAAGGGSNTVQHLAAADAAAAAAAAIAIAGFTTPAAGIKSSAGGVLGSEVRTLGTAAAAAAAAAGGSSAIASRDRRPTLSLGPNLLQHLAKESGSDSDAPQQQQQYHGRSSLGGSNGGGSSRFVLPFTAASHGNGARLQGVSPPHAAVPAAAPAVGSKRRAPAAAAAREDVQSPGAPAAAGDLEVPPSKRQAVGAAAKASNAADAGAAGTPAATATPAAGAVARAAAAGGAGVPRQVSSPVQSSKQRSSLGNKTQGLGTRGSSDADFLQTLQQQQQSGQALEAVFHSQNLPATPAAGAYKDAAAAAAAGAGARGPGARSPHPGTASNVTNVTNGPSFLSPSPGPWFGPSLDTPLPPAPATTPVSLPLPPPGSTPAAAAAAAAAGGGGGGQVAGAALAAAAAASGVNPLLTNLPSSTKWGSGKGGASSLQRRLSGGAESIPHRLTSIAEAAPEPKPLPLHVQVAARDVMTGPPVNSRLGAIVTAYLRQQHRAACLTAAQPMSVVPPVSLLKPYSLPVATRPLNAPANVTLRLARQEVWGGFGGRGGAAATRRLVWSRFRLTNTLRDDGPLLTSCCFLRGFETLVAGTASGELKLHDAYNGETVELVDAHSAPVNLLQAAPNPGGAAGDQLLLSSSRSEVLLWRADGFDAGPVYTWPGITRGRFNSLGTQLVAVAVGSSPRQARVYDSTTGDIIATLDEAAAAAAAVAAASVGVGGSSNAAGVSNGAGGGAGGGEMVRGSASACFSPSGELVLWGATLWDPRVPAPLHTFDQLSSNAGGAGGIFHPNGGEIILNSEVWDLRTRKLLRSVPLLDGTSITFSSGGEVLCAWLRRPADDSMAALLQPKRRRHALATSFAILDARTYSEIANVQVERALLDLCLDPSDSYLAAVAVDMGTSLAEGSVSSSVRLYEVGRQPPGEDDEDGSDAAGEDEEEDEDESDESEEEGDDGEGGMLQALLGDQDDEGGEDHPGGRAGDGAAARAGLGDLDDGLDDADASDLDEEAVNALREEFADLYEEALAAGIDPDELDISIDDEYEDGDEGSDGVGPEDEEELMAALEGDVSSSSYETDDEA